jgi:hypothetical protein
MAINWPYIGLKSGGIKRGELVVIGAYSKSSIGIRTIINEKAVCMYQIQVKRFTDHDWTNYLRPWLTKQTASDIIAALENLDAERDDAGRWLYQIVEV